MADDATRAEVVKIGFEVASLALASYHGRKLRKAERDELLRLVREVEAKRKFTPTDAILGRDDGSTGGGD